MSLKKPRKSTHFISEKSMSRETAQKPRTFTSKKICDPEPKNQQCTLSPRSIYEHEASKIRSLKDHKLVRMKPNKPIIIYYIA
jgi:hypothetical protein